MAVDFFSSTCYQYDIELYIDTTNNHAALTSYFANPSFKKLLGNTNSVSIEPAVAVTWYIIIRYYYIKYILRMAFCGFLYLHKCF